MTAAHRTIFSLLATIADSIRLTKSGAVRLHLGRVRIYIDSDEVSVWRVGAAAIEYRWTATKPAPETAPVLPWAPCAHDHTVSRPARAYRPVWRTSPRPASWRLAGVA